jgi:hypothetical protein
MWIIKFVLSKLLSGSDGDNGKATAVVLFVVVVFTFTWLLKHIGII